MKLGYARVSPDEQTSVFRSAEFSADRARRFLLTRSWYGRDMPRLVNLIGLNPSDADETRDDMTIRKGCGFARRWGMNGLIMSNLSPFVSTDPGQLPMWSGLDPANTEALQRAIAAADLVVAAWGSVPRHIARNIALPELIYHVRSLCKGTLYCIGETADGSPMHPSRCAYTDCPLVWRGAL